MAMTYFRLRWVRHPLVAALLLAGCEANMAIKTNDPKSAAQNNRGGSTTSPTSRVLPNQVLATTADNTGIRVSWHPASQPPDLNDLYQVFVSQQLQSKIILFYDGTCGLCHKFVAFTSKIDKRGRIFFAPLQGETAASLLPDAFRTDLNTVVLRDIDGTMSLKSDAMVAILRLSAFPWTLLGSLLRVAPRFVRNFGYDVIAQNRYRVFGQFDTCRLPTVEERARLLP